MILIDKKWRVREYLSYCTFTDTCYLNCQRVIIGWKRNGKYSELDVCSICNITESNKISLKFHHLLRINIAKLFTVYSTKF